MSNDIIVREMQAEGATYTNVAQKLDLPYEMVRSVSHEAGIVRKRGVPVGTRGVRRNHKIDDEKLKQLVADGIGLKAIASHFSCTKQAVWCAKKRLGLPSSK
jgi:hypothetical protein